MTATKTQRNSMTTDLELDNNNNTNDSISLIPSTYLVAIGQAANIDDSHTILSFQLEQQHLVRGVENEQQAQKNNDEATSMNLRRLQEEIDAIAADPTQVRSELPLSTLPTNALSRAPSAPTTPTQCESFKERRFGSSEGSARAPPFPTRLLPWIGSSTRTLYTDCTLWSSPSSDDRLRRLPKIPWSGSSRPIAMKMRTTSTHG